MADARPLGAPDLDAIERERGVDERDIPRLVAALREAWAQINVLTVALAPFGAVGGDIPKDIDDEASIVHLPDISVGEWREAARLTEATDDE